MQNDCVASSLLLGRDFDHYGLVHTEQVSGNAAVAISVGRDTNSPSLRFKHDPSVKNEDAVFVVESADRVAFAVADAHFGPESSHGLMSQIFISLTSEIPQNLDELYSRVTSAGERLAPKTRSETTCVVVVHDWTSRKGFGVSVGDSTIRVVSRDGSTGVLNQLNQQYVSASTISTSNGWTSFSFETAPGDFLLGFTDGVDECHYRNASTSIQESDITSLVLDSGFETLTAVDRLAALALTGVRSNPGGQDNIAIVAVAAP